MTHNLESIRTAGAMDEASASILTAFTSTSRLTKASSLDTATTNSTCTLTNESVVSSSASSLVDPNNDLIRFTVATKLKRISDADKLRKISSKGRSIKFPVKLMFLLEECKEFESIISWAPDGLSFIIHDTKQLEEQVLPKKFKETKYGSFLRKLYRWRFMKRSLHGKKISYIHEKFQRGNYSLCMEMACRSQSLAKSGYLGDAMESTRAGQSEESLSFIPITGTSLNLNAIPQNYDTSSYYEMTQIYMRNKQNLERQELELLRQQQEEQEQLSDAILLNAFMSDTLLDTNKNDNFNSNMMPGLYHSNVSSQFLHSTPPAPPSLSWTMEENLQLRRQNLERKYRLQQKNQLQQGYPENSNYVPLKTKNLIQNTLCVPMNGKNCSDAIDSYRMTPTLGAMFCNQNPLASMNKQNQYQCEYQYGYPSPKLQQHPKPKSQSQPKDVCSPSIQEKKSSSNKDSTAAALTDVATAPSTNGTGIVRRGGNFY